MPPVVSPRARRLAWGGGSTFVIGAQVLFARVSELPAYAIFAPGRPGGGALRTGPRFCAPSLLWGDSVIPASAKKSWSGWLESPDAPLLDPHASPYFCRHQITPKTSRYTRCSMSMLPNVSINRRTRSSGQLGRWWYSISPCRNNECVRRFTVFAFNQRS